MTQSDAILMHLCRGDNLTALDAVHLFDCMRLGARIKDLRDEGHVINTAIHSKGKKHWAVYWMDLPSIEYTMKKRGWK